MKRTFAVLVGLSVWLSAGAQDGHYRPYRVSTDLHEVANLKTVTKTFTVPAEARKLLAKNLFVVTPTDDKQLYFVYSENDYLNIPSLVTADSALHTYHVFYDALLRQIEQTSLTVKLARLNRNLYEQTQAQYRQAKEPAMKQAALANLAYFAVGEGLLGHPLPSDLPEAAKGMAEAEIKLVDAQSGFEQSPLFGGKVDYSMFIVRGHYTKSDVLKKYFRAMSWYSMPFALADQSGVPNPQMIMRSLLISDAFKVGTMKADWNGIYEPTALFVGPSNMYTPFEFTQVAEKTIYTGHARATGGYVKLLNGLSAIRKPGIVSTRKGTGMNPNMQFRVMGRRFILDSMMLQRLTGEERGMPSGLDVMAVFGSTRAANILDGNPARYNPQGWSEYKPRRNQLEADVASKYDDMWGSNLYWGWLATLRSYVKPVPSGSPSFMRGTAWQDKKLSTALGSWTELRHDTILYGEQSVAEMGDGGEVPPVVKGFVEPEVETYNRLIALLKKTRSELTKRGMLQKKASEPLDAFIGTVIFMRDVSRKELAGKRLTAEEHLRIRHIEQEFSDPTETMLLYGTAFKQMNDDQKDMALVADVHTAHTTALEEAVGHADVVTAIVPIDGKLYLARGDVYSYYEFAVPISQRMTDEAWKELLNSGKAPARPHWTKSFFTSKAIKAKS